MYQILKHAHLTFVALSLLSFGVRGIDLFVHASVLENRWVKPLAHVISALLLVSGFVLAAQLSMSPGNQPWLMAKLVGLVVYVGLGIAAFRVPNPNARRLFWVGALVVFAYIVSVAFSKNPLGFLG